MNGGLLELRILVVDDDEVDRLRIGRLIAQIPDLDAEVRAAADVRSSLDTVKREPFDLVLLDYRLPDGTALDFLAGVGAADGLGPPVVVQTVQDSDLAAIDTLARGAQDYLVKGRFDAPALHRAIRYALERDRLVKERARLRSELVKASERISTLEGLLPICSYCKGVRDDSGHWHRIEAYLATTGTRMTHSMCPACAAQRFPDHYR
jgi:sigma-B regulation protein RsbU (phosphoserine phosphatase)